MQSIMNLGQTYKILILFRLVVYTALNVPLLRVILVRIFRIRTEYGPE